MRYYCIGRVGNVYCYKWVKLLCSCMEIRCVIWDSTRRLQQTTIGVGGGVGEYVIIREKDF